ncbi:MAG: polyprenyl synthetase family protein [Bacteroidales bacterium]|jgi:geranylgeranyl diphosphate synthase type II|nr:polyprenyl synthetase family protein [Bacteroidales bacterium]
MYTLEQCSSLVEEQLKQLAIGAKTPAGLYEPVDYVMAAGGKRVRPVLALMACNLFVDDLTKSLMPAVALEVFHNFTLLHDDVMDNADVRRNRPTVHKRWNESTAILSGDAMMILAYRYMCRAQPEILPSLLDTFTRTALEVCEGQQYDMDFEQRTDVSIDEYLHMIRLKTAVLLAACLKTGAICGSANAANAESLYKFGISLGLTFQIQDDWLDVYAEPGVFGKAIGGDILSGKKTYLLLTAFEKADDRTREELSVLLNHQKMPGNEKISRVKVIYNQLGVSDTARQAMDGHYQQAMSHLREVILPDESRKVVLEKFAATLLKREK